MIKPTQTQQTKPKTKAITLHTLYNNLNNAQKIIFKDKMIDVCGKTESTIYTWIQGKKIPTLLEQKEIAKFFKMPHTKIF